MDASFADRSMSLYDWQTRFHGESRDEETGYYNYGYRYYDPKTGRWLSRDPIGERGGLNLYGFTYNTPTDSIDVLGREPVTIAIIAATAIYGMIVGGAAIHDVQLEAEAAEANRRHAERLAELGLENGANAAQRESAENVRRAAAAAATAVAAIPGTSITGPASGPMTTINPTSAVDVLSNAAQTISKLKRIKCVCDQKSFATKFKGFKDSMEAAGYRWVQNPGQSSNIPGGHFRRPTSNPEHLPHPGDVNRQLRALFESACGAGTGE
jgi:RHS repeat-associated protein